MPNSYELEFPYLFKIIQNKLSLELEKWIQAQEQYFVLLEEDLKNLINNSVDLENLRRCYKNNFARAFNILETIYEIHFGSLLATIGLSIELRVPKSKRNKKNFDFKINLNNSELNFEVETRKDMFPFRGKRLKDTPIYTDRRETVDQRLFGKIIKGNPESTVDLPPINVPPVELDF